MFILLAEGETLQSDLFKIELAIMRAVAGARHSGEFLCVLGPCFLRNDRKLIDRADVLYARKIEAVGQNIIGECTHGVARSAKGKGRSHWQRIMIEQTGIVQRLQRVAPGGTSMAV